MKFKLGVLVLSAFASFGAFAVVTSPFVNSARYATDAYPAFDDIDKVNKPEKKTPRWYSFICGTEKDAPGEQFAWSRICEVANDLKAAMSGYDKLVRAWPTSAEAPIAQLRLAELALKAGDYADAFEHYQYMLDFYSSQCDFDAIALEMYKLAELMYREGKTIAFFHFRNLVDVRHAYEALILRSPGAPFAPKAMLTVARIRAEEKRFDKAVEVCENLRNIYPGTPEAATALYAEAEYRMKLVRGHAYNQSRVQDTCNFLQMAKIELTDEKERAAIGKWIVEVNAVLENEAWEAAKFYDSRTRTKRSSINAYEDYLDRYPEGAHAAAAKARLQQLKED